MGRDAKGDRNTAERKEGFLDRWSRLKRAEHAPAPSPAPAEPVASPATDATAMAAADDGAAAEGSAVPAAQDLPPVESLDRDSDFTGFMRPGVPTALRNTALRKLWRTDPLLANLDGLVEYGDDFTAPWKSSSVVATAYRVGKGMVRAATDAEDAAESPPQSEAAAPAGQAAGGTKAMPGETAADSADSASAKSDLPQPRPARASEDTAT